MMNSMHKENTLKFDPGVPRRDHMLRPEMMADRLSRLFRREIDECRIIRVKYRPGQNLRVLYKVLYAGSATYVSSRTFKKVRAQQIYSQGVRKARAAGGPLLDESGEVLYWAFPGDRKVTQLDQLYSSDPVLEFRGGCWKLLELAAYAPEKCATFKCEDLASGDPAYAKIYSGEEASKAAFVYRSLSRRQDSKAIAPKLLAYSDRLRTTIIEAVNGERLADLDEHCRTKGYRQLGTALARFHSLGPLTDRRRASCSRKHNLMRTLSHFRLVSPELRARAAVLARRLCSRETEGGRESVLLHGDVHAKNAIVTGAGNAVLIDLDQARTGPASEDVGSLIAALYYKECVGELSAADRGRLTTAFLEGYEVKRRLPSGDELRRSIGFALFTERCRRAISRYRTDAIQRLGDIMSIAHSLLDGRTL